MVPNTTLHTIKLGLGVASHPAPSRHWLLGPWSPSPVRRAAQVAFLLGALTVCGAWFAWLYRLIF